jgi:hypothetical protein
VKQLPVRWKNGLVSLTPAILVHIYCRSVGLIVWNFRPFGGFLIVTKLIARVVLTLKKAMPPTMKTIVLYGTARSLVLAHLCKILHHDVQRRNVFIDDRKYPHVGGFAMAKFDIGGTATVRPQTNYTAPKVINRSESKDIMAAINFFSLDAIFWEIFKQLAWTPKAPQGRPETSSGENRVVIARDGWLVRPSDN